MNKILILLFFTNFSFSQEKQITTSEHLQDRQGKLFFKVETEYRIGAKYTTRAFQLSRSDYKGFTSIYRQLTGTCLNYNISYFFTKNLDFGFTHSMHYGLLNFEDDLKSTARTNPSNNTLIMDYHLYLEYYIKIFKKNQIFVRYGQSLMNRNTNYSNKIDFYAPDGTYLGTSLSDVNYNFTASNYAIGLKADRFDLMLGAYFATNTEYPYVDKLTIPYIKLSYNLGKL